jgi:hypothetical protein
MSRLAKTGSLGSLGGVRKNIRVLRWRGWLSTEKKAGPSPTTYELRMRAGRRNGERTVAIPGSLAIHLRLPAAAKRLYAKLLAHRLPGLPGFTGQRRELIKTIGLGSERTVRYLIAQLRDAGWLRIDRTNQRFVHAYIPLDPHLATREAERDAVEERLLRSPTKGETLMKEMLDVLVPDRRYRENARKGDLKNPITGENLELDRRYESGIAFEYNGRQHYELTEDFPDPKALHKQRYRDLEKRAQAEQHGIDIVTLHAEDLSFAVIGTKIAGRLPVRELRWEDPVVAFLESYGREHMRKAEFARQRDVLRGKRASAPETITTT